MHWVALQKPQLAATHKDEIADVLRAAFISAAKRAGIMPRGTNCMNARVIKNPPQDTSPPRSDEVSDLTSIALLSVHYFHWGPC